MTYQGTNPSALRSRREIVRAFFSLLEHHSFEELTVSRIMEAAALSRQTFYQIFSSKEEILEYYLDTVFESFICENDLCCVENLCDVAKLFFEFFARCEQTFSLILRSGKSCVLQRKCLEYLQKSPHIRCALCGVQTPWEQEYAAIFVISGMVSMLEQWLREPAGERAEPHLLAQLVCRMTDLSCR